MEIVITIIQLVTSVALIGIVLFQSGKNVGLSGAIAGNTDTFLSRNKSRTVDAKLAKATKWVAIVFVILTLILSLI